MLPSSDARLQLDNDAPSSFRAVLKSLINDNKVSSILIGETHEISPTLDAILSNLDILAASPRRVILITEDLNQSDNTAFKSALRKTEKGDIDSLKKLTFLKGKTISIYQLIYSSFSAGLLVQGAENKKTNPFCDYEQNDFSVLRKMEAYQKSPERITVTNSEFAKLIHDFCSEDTLPIFLGGAAHVVALSSGDTLFDAGLQGRVKNSVSIYLCDGATPAISLSFDYTVTDRELTGQYDYMVLTNKKVLYDEAFSDIDGLNDKIEYFITVLDRLLHSYILYFNNVSWLLRTDLNPIIEAFQDSIKCPCAFKSLDKIFEDVIQQREKPKEKFLFFTLPKLVEGYTKKELKLAIYDDLAEFLQSRPLKSS